VMISGGSEAAITTMGLGSFIACKALSMRNDSPESASRPFDRDRDGFVFGEAGALMVIETEEHAKARSANIIGRLMGAGITSDGYHPVLADPSGEQAGRAMTRAIQLAGLAPGDIDHVNAHATGTIVGDLAEAKAISRALGAHSPAVYAPKAALGHSIGAVGAVESILTVLALRDGVIPPGPPAKTLAVAILGALEGLAIHIAGTPYDELIAERTVRGALGLNAP